jgi:fatty acid desaturase
MPDSSQATHYTPWVSRAAFPVVNVTFYLVQALLIYSISQGWVWPTILLVIVVSHLMHAMLIAFHETTHGSLRKNRVLNDLDGMLMGIFSFTSFNLYRTLHQQHHVNLATEKDVELWPFNDPKAPLWKRRLAAFCELNFGLFFTPFLFWRNFFGKNPMVRSPKVRRSIWIEFWVCIAFWTVALSLVVHFQVWPYFFLNYFIPALIAGNLQSWRKYIEHIGLSGNSARSATRSIIADTWGGRMMSLTLLHEPLHGVHHVKSSLPYAEMPEHTDWLTPSDAGDTRPYPNYRAALKDLLQQLPDPKVGEQWGEAKAAPAAPPQSKSREEVGNAA